ncbi:MAG TPA: hypothetical protein V6D19_16675 [Stenomitos sp.]
MNQIKILAAVLLLGMTATLGACSSGSDAPAGSPSASPSPSTSPST